MGYGAIGTDTAGSIREPAALCGVVGLKPTYGRVSAEGVIPLSESLDHVGPIARTVADVTVVLQAIATDNGKNQGLPASDFLSLWKAADRSLRIGMPRSYFYDDLDPEVSTAVEEALRVLAMRAREIREIELRPDTDRTLQAAETYAFHAESVAKTPALYQPETLRRIKREKMSRATSMCAACRTRCSAPEHSTDVRDHRCVRHANHRHPGALDCRTATAPRTATSTRIVAVAKHATAECLGIAGNFFALRIY